jgi:hypothetical protein
MALTQRTFRVRTDAGAVDAASPTWGAAQDSNYYPGLETNFRLRFSVNNTASTAGGPYTLYLSKNGGAYVAITTSSTNGVQSANASSDADGAAIATANFRLGAGSGTASAGVYDETGSATKSLSASTYTEFEFGLIIKTANVNPTDTLDFRVYNNTTAFGTYTQTPRITVAQAPQTGSVFTDYGELGRTIRYNSAGIGFLNCGTTRSVSAGQMVVLMVVTDNTSTSNSDAGVVSSVTDSGGNTYTKAKEWQLGSPGALAGSVCSLWYGVITTPLSIAQDVTANFTGSADRDAVVLLSHEFGISGPIEVVDTNSATATASSTLASLNVTTPNVECLRIRLAGLETNAAQSFYTRRTSGWNALGGSGVIASSGTAGTSQTLVGEYRISTGTGDASAPSTLVGAVDHCSIYVAFKLTIPNHACLANDISSASSVSQPALTQIVNNACLANDVRSGSWVGADPATVLIHADGTDTSTTFTDATGKHTVTATGNAQVDTGQSKFGGASVQTAGAGSLSDTPSYLSISSASDLAFGTGDFTIDFWIRPTARPVDGVILFDWRPGGADGPYPMFAWHANWNLYYWVGYFQIVTGSIALDVWTHIALTRAGTNTRLFYDGVLQGTYADDTNDYACPSNPIWMGATSGLVLPGCMDEIRIVKGMAMWTANFTPPTAPYSIGPVIHQVHSALANDVVSTSDTPTPAAVIRRDLLANDVTSTSDTPTPAAVIRRDLLANDVSSVSSVGQPVAGIRRNLLANDVSSASSVTSPTQLAQRHSVLANDISSASSVTIEVATTMGAKAMHQHQMRRA